MIKTIMSILLFMIEHPEVIVAICIFDVVGIVLLEWESRRYYKRHPEELKVQEKKEKKNVE